MLDKGGAVMFCAHATSARCVVRCTINHHALDAPATLTVICKISGRPSAARSAHNSRAPKNSLNLSQGDGLHADRSGNTQMQSLKEGAQRAVEVVEVGTSKAAAVLSGGAGQEADPEHHVENKVAACSCWSLLAYVRRIGCSCKNTHDPFMANSPCRVCTAQLHCLACGPQAAAPADSDLGGAAWRQAPGPLEKMRESAAHAVEGVKLRLHLGSAGATAEQRTGGSGWRLFTTSHQGAPPPPPFFPQ